MKKLLVIAVIAAFVIACGNDKKQSASTTEKSATPAVAEGPDGEKIYKQYCVTCHGVYGDMGASGAFNLTESKLTAEERINVITNGRTGTVMVAFKTTLSEEQIAAVAKYTESLKK